MKRVTIVSVLIFMALSANAQFTDSSTGLLNMPSADMNQSGTFTITNNFLNKHSLPSRSWDYSTFGYGFGITFFSRLEVSYICTIWNSEWSPSYPKPDDYRFNILKNQDRHFSAKVQALKEGEIWKWTPSIALGVCDPVTGSGGDYVQGNVGETGNGYFNRYYLVATKHFETKWGRFGSHLGYQHSKRTDWNRKGVIAAIDWRPVWLQNRWFSPKFIMEYDANTPNFGFIADIWDDRFETMFCLQNFQWISFGLMYKLRLKGSE